MLAIEQRNQHGHSTKTLSLKLSFSGASGPEREAKGDEECYVSMGLVKHPITRAQRWPHDIREEL